MGDAPLALPLLAISGCEPAPSEPPATALQLASALHNGFCGILEDRSAYCWGYDADEGMTAPEGEAVDLAVGDRPCILTADGSPRCGDPGYSARDVPVSGDGFVDIAVGQDFACALDAGGEIECWGDAPSVEAGRWVALAAGSTSLCALGEAGEITCWAPDHGFEPPRGPFVDFDACQEAVCGVTEEGEVRCQGYGLEDDERRARSISVVDWGLACGVSARGVVRCFQDPVLRRRLALPEFEGQYLSVEVGGLDACAIRSDQAVVCEAIPYYSY